MRETDMFFLTLALRGGKDEEENNGRKQEDDSREAREKVIHHHHITKGHTGIPRITALSPLYKARSSYNVDSLITSFLLKNLKFSYLA